ncbi:MAG: hypothetical protein JWP91_2082 [Fibrobacteres bacterium]|nr:hypothetical protein [Fibrobacterota bacterium]
MRFPTALMLFSLPSGLLAQSAIYVPYRNSAMWSSDTLYVGASFLYTGAASGGGGKWKGGFGTLEPITVTLKGNEAGWTGELWAVVQSATGKEEEVFLFTNHDAPGTSVDLRTKVSFPIPTGAEITFMYKVVAGCAFFGCWSITPEDQLPKYSGPNRGYDRHRSAATSDIMPNPNWRFGNRWSVVGRDKDGNLEFGFEDCTQAFSDMDFDDVVFTVTNLEIGIFNRKLLSKDLVR